MTTLKDGCAFLSNWASPLNGRGAVTIWRSSRTSTTGEPCLSIAAASLTRNPESALPGRPDFSRYVHPSAPQGLDDVRPEGLGPVVVLIECDPGDGERVGPGGRPRCDRHRLACSRRPADQRERALRSSPDPLVDPWPGDQPGRQAGYGDLGGNDRVFWTGNPQPRRTRCARRHRGALTLPHKLPRASDLSANQGP